MIASRAAAEIRLPARLDAIAEMNTWYDAAMAGAEVSDTVRGDLRLCLNEAVANAISHGLAGIAAPVLRVSLRSGPGWAEAEVLDNGAAFDPLDAPLAAPITGLETAQIGGFGLKLIRETAQALAYARRDGHNRLTITCREPRAPAR